MVKRFFDVSMRAELADAEKLRDLIKRFDIQVHLVRDTEDQRLWYTTANQVPPDILKKMKSYILQFSKTHSYRHLCIETEYDCYYWFGEAPEECLDVFLNDPKDVVFPPFSTLKDGCTKCLLNSIELADSAEALLESGKAAHHAVALLVTSFEELGKACLIQSAGKEARTNKAATIRGFLNHQAKMKALARQLLGERRKISKYAIKRSGGAWSDMVRAARFHDPELMDALTDESLPMVIRVLEAFGSLPREIALYVSYSGGLRLWKYPSTLLRKETIRSLSKFLKLCSRKMLEELQTKNIDESRNLADLFE